MGGRKRDVFYMYDLRRALGASDIYICDMEFWIMMDGAMVLLRSACLEMDI